MTKAFHAILHPAVVTGALVLRCLRRTGSYPLSKGLRKRHYESHKSCKPEYLTLKMKTIAFPGSLYTYYLSLSNRKE